MIDRERENLFSEAEVEMYKAEKSARYSDNRAAIVHIGAAIEKLKLYKEQMEKKYL